MADKTNPNYTSRIASWDFENMRVSIPISKIQAHLAKKTIEAGRELNWSLNIDDTQSD